ncbi:MmgE/PrpD family protein [Lutimaribacter marinistellae]|uniref:MmgE/PrpD family protein n=1 Tax=Lutimaribacter marinistellae TaxID=1820329 RepID=A0ABV7TQK6_9RHOB
MTSLTNALAGFATGPVTTTPDARVVAALSALDWVAVGCAGADEPVSRITRSMILDEGGAEAATLFGGGAAPVRGAALVNGTVSHALDYDDTHFAHIGHPSVAVFPAALSWAEANGQALVEMLEAALVGMELSVRVGLWLGRGHYQVGFHQTATAGAFGAAAAAGRLAGLTSAQMAQAMGLTATRAAGLKAQFGTMGKPYNAGTAAANGIEAVQLVRLGFEAEVLAMEGDFGFGATHHGADDMQAALEGLGQEWLFEQVSHKFHACCHGLHAALEAARELDIAEPEVEHITVRSHPRWMSVCNQPSPMTGLGAKFSFRTVLAMRALGYDTARLDAFSDKVCAEPRLQALRERVTVEADDTLSETEAVVTLLRRDGQERVARHDLRGPMTLSAREERVRGKAVGLIGKARVDGIWELLQRGGAASDLARYLGG